MTRSEVMRGARLVRRRFVRKGILLSAEAFCQRRVISRDELVRQERSGEVFVMVVDGTRHYPAFLADNILNRHRLTKLLRRMPPALPPELLFDLFMARRGSLGDKSPLQAIRRGARYRVAMRLADSLAEEYRRGLNRGTRRPLARDIRVRRRVPR